MKEYIKKIISPSRIFTFQCKLNRYFGGNHYSGLKGNSISIENSILKGVRFKFHGKNNQIIIGKNNRLKNCTFEIFGDNCQVSIGDGNSFNEINFWVEDNQSSIEVGDNNILCGNATLAVAEETKLKIGNDCLFSINIYITTSDSHSVIDRKVNKRTNPSQNISIGNHVWIGRDVTIGKGVSIPDDVIIGGKSYVTKSFQEPHVALAGIPARVIKEDCTWNADRI